MNGVQIIYDSYTEFTAAHLPTVPVMRQNKRIASRREIGSTLDGITS